MWILIDEGDLFEGEPWNFEDCFGLPGTANVEEMSDEDVLNYVLAWAIEVDQDSTVRVLTNEGLLQRLNNERLIPNEWSAHYMTAVAKYLVKQGVYPETTPAMEKQGWTHLEMIQNYGAFWHQS